MKVILNFYSLVFVIFIPSVSVNCFLAVGECIGLMT